MKNSREHIIAKKNIIKNNLWIIIGCLLLYLVFNTAFTQNYEKKDDIYDVVLFWGQSNMVGYCGLKKNEQKKDIRFDHNDLKVIESISKITAIDKKILSYEQQMNWIQIKPKNNSAYEYIYSSNSLKEIDENTKTFGERLKYNVTTKGLVYPEGKAFSIQKSFGTNMIPQFCKTYYEKTGHKVIAVLAANGGEKIANFLPMTDPEYGDVKKQAIYESMVEKYDAAIDYMQQNNLKIGRKLWVAFQGEADVRKTSTDKYKRLFQKIHNYLRRDLNILKGAIVETSVTIGTDLYSQVNNINRAQKQLAQENNDIIIGSSYAYDRYIPNEETYNSIHYYNKTFTDGVGAKLPYTQAFKIASYSVCYPNNTIHFTSAALCQIGKETAEELADSFKKND